MTTELYNCDCLDLLWLLKADSIDSLVTDPPAGIAFMGKDWDKDKGGRAGWVAWMTDVMRECYRVLKPGAHGLVWAIPRTSHWTGTALEDAGFEIRDVVTHLFGTGFPKSLDVSKAIDKAAGAEREVIGFLPAGTGPLKRGHVASTGGGLSVGTERSPELRITTSTTDAAKQWQGFGTALKPAAEFWWLVRKPCSEKTVAANMLKWGCGALNIDGCRIKGGERPAIDGTAKTTPSQFGAMGGSKAVGTTTQGRFPANLVLDEEAAAVLDEQNGISKSNAGPRGGQGFHNSLGRPNQPRGDGDKISGHADSGGASRFFYTSKASKSDRGEGNTHPTVKSTKLMGYLCRLVTPPGGTVLDPFMGSGSTGVATRAGGFSFLGIEKETEYFKIARKRSK